MAARHLRSNAALAELLQVRFFYLLRDVGYLGFQLFRFVPAIGKVFSGEALGTLARVDCIFCWDAESFKLYFHDRSEIDEYPLPFSNESFWIFRKISEDVFLDLEMFPADTWADSYGNISKRSAERFDDFDSLSKYSSCNPSPSAVYESDDVMRRIFEIYREAVRTGQGEDDILFFCHECIGIEEEFR